MCSQNGKIRPDLALNLSVIKPSYIIKYQYIRGLWFSGMLGKAIANRLTGLEMNNQKG